VPKFEDNLSPYLTLVEQGSTPASPAAGNRKAYVRTSDHSLVAVDSTGTVVALGGGGGGGGDLVLLEEHTASSSATLDFTSCFSSTYDEYLVEVVHLLPATDAVNLKMTVSTDGGSTWQAGTGYNYAYSYILLNGSSTGNANGAAGAFASLGNAISSTASRGGISSSVRFYDPLSAAANKPFLYDSVEANSGDSNMYRYVGGGWWASTTAVNALRFAFSSGNIASGTIRIYGVAKTSGVTSTDVIKTNVGAGQVYIPGLRGSPDALPASPNAKDDEFEALSGWTTLGTLDTSNVTDYPSHYHIKRISSAAEVDGIYKTAPSMPFTVTAKIAAANIDNGSPGHRSVGILLADSTPTALALVEFNFATGGQFAISCRKWASRTSFTSALNDTNIWTASAMVTPPMPLYLRALVTSSTSVTVSYSLDGFIFHTTATVNPGITFANFGLSVSDPTDSGGNTVEGIIDSIRIT
jgi:hypothetical protein